MNSGHMLPGIPNGDLVRLAGGSGWQALAASALLGLGEDAFAPLADHPEPIAAFYLAVGHWMAGNEPQAIGLLEQLPDLAYAARLLALIRQERIEVLAFLPAARRQPHLLAEGARSDTKFRLRNIVFGEGETPNRPDANIRHFYDASGVPDFLICEMIEWHVLPRNLQDFPAPAIAHSSDLDLHPQTLPPFMRLFDVMLTLGTMEWQGAQALMPAERCLIYPNAFALKAAPPLDEGAPRPIDFLQTNTVFSSFHRDKEMVLKRVIDTPGLAYFLHNGALPDAVYQGLLRRSKLTLSYIRNTDSMSTRAMETLGAGACCLVPPDSVLHLYVPPGHGLIAADQADAAALRRAVLAVTRHEVERYRLEGRRGAALMREIFSAGRVGSRYLRFCTVMAALSTKAPHVAPPPTQPRHIAWLGHVPGSGRKDVIDALRESNDRLAAAQDAPLYRRLNDRGRNAVLDHNLRAVLSRHDIGDALLRRGLADFGAGCAEAPDALAPAFNLMRAAFHFGTEEDKIAAEAVARRILTQPRSSWRLDLADDLLPYDFMPAFANTRHLMAALLDWAAGDNAARARVMDTILAATHFYLGWRLGALDSFRHALALDPDFAEARLAYCHALLDSGEARDAVLAIEELERYAGQYTATGEVAPLLMRARRQAGRSDLQALPATIEDSTIDMTVDYYNDFPVMCKTARRYFADVDCIVDRMTAATKPISLIVADRHLRWQPDMAALHRAAAPDDAIETVFFERYARLDALGTGWCDVAIQDLRPPGIVDHLGRSFNRAFLEAHGDILIFAEGLADLSPALLVETARHVRPGSKASTEAGQIVVARTPGATAAPRPQWIALHRHDFLRLGGFDNSFNCQGHRGGVLELVWRARNAGLAALETLSGAFRPAQWLADLTLADSYSPAASSAIELIAASAWQDPERFSPLWADPAVTKLAAAE